MNRKMIGEAIYILKGFGLEMCRPTAMYMYLYKYVEDTNTGFNSTGDNLHI
jgi:hypothetical protein